MKLNRVYFLLTYFFNVHYEIKKKRLRESFQKNIIYNYIRTTS